MPSQEDEFRYNVPYAKTGPYQTQLRPSEEPYFRLWQMLNRVPDEPGDLGYDLRGYWKDNVSQSRTPAYTIPSKTTGIDPVDHLMHYTDLYKTPYSSEGFNTESKYAVKGDFPMWIGRSTFDDKGVREILSSMLGLGGK